MKIPNVDHIRYGQNYRSSHPSDHGDHHLTFRKIYEAINHQDDFNEPQLFYLSRLVDRKLKALDPRLTADDLEARPYRTMHK